ncbi:unnamed protein product [Polarella glacialis]|uniref:Uncharacterized protein n=1 Tax=Polarella glacialis TaxID=89957 RepID=A0A813GUL3_POLGL|nr:unnamed protein product [Polarella glacialis]CAE8629288.1 unnamed protein product [Polarella glacialis]
MLHRCVAGSTTWCPQLNEDDFGGFVYSGASPQMYSNPFSYEEGDFPPGALALMYDPPIDDDLDDSPSWLAPRNGGGGGLGAESLGTSSFPSTSANTIPFGMEFNGSFASKGAVSSTDEPDPSNGLSGYGLSGLGVPPIGPNAGPRERPQISLSLKPLGSMGFQPRTSSRTLRASAEPSETDDGQPRSFSRTVREAQSCTSEAGAASIAAILKCVAQVQEVPAQQRPNSEKWSERWNGYHLEKHVR